MTSTKLALCRARRAVLTGVMSLCSLALAAPAFAQANNPCSGAINIPLAGLGSSATVSGSTSAATTDSPAACVGLGKDVWYKVTVPAGVTAEVSAETCGGSTNFDTAIALYRIPNPASPCPVSAANLLTCVDDSCGTQTIAAATVSGGAAGQVVYIRLGGFSADSGNFTLLVSLNAPPPPPTAGPDVTVWSHTDIARQGTGTANGVAVAAYAIGTESCNRGDTPVAWYDFAPRENEHPVIAQNIYRFRNFSENGVTYQRFEQLGQSWLKHGFASVNGTSCGSCIQPPGGGSELGINCSDPYDSGLNGSPFLLGRRSLVNPTTGFFPAPVVQGDALGTEAIRGRCLVPTAETSGQPAGTRYFGETHYITQDDAQFVAPGQTVATNALNNATWQEITAGSINSAAPTLAAGIRRQETAINAWRQADPAVTLIHVHHDDVSNPSAAFPGTTIRSRFSVAAKVTDLGNGTWRYEYAVHNMNSERAAGAVSVPAGDATTITGYTFHHPMSHSGEPFSNTAWTMTKSGGRLTFATQPFATNQNANAIRWGTLYNFGFTATAPPVTGDLRLDLFKPGTGANPPAFVLASGVPVPTMPPTLCPGDFNADGEVNPDDLGDYINCYFATPPCGLADFNADGSVDPDDLGDFINAYFGPCP